MGTHAVQKGPVADRVAENVKAVRELRGLSYRELSRHLAEVGHRILPSGLVKIEDGSRRVDVDDLVALALVLRVPLPRLLLPGADTGAPVQLTTNTALDFTAAWRWARGELLPGVPPEPDGDGWVKVPTELLGFVRAGHPDLFDAESLTVSAYQTRLSAVLHARVAEIDNVRFRPRKGRTDSRTDQED